MKRYFNIAGPCFPGKHYMLPALDRLPGVRRLIDREQYFVIHAPRQTGKTTALQALAREINEGGEKVALYCTLETLQNATDVDWAMTQIRGLLLRSERAVARWMPLQGGLEAREDGGFYTVSVVSDTLEEICGRAGKPLAVFDDDASKSWDEKIYTRDEVFNGKTIHVIGL